MTMHKKVIHERRKKERGKRIQSILDAAREVFLSKGYLKTTMDEIALKAEISKPTIYQYFETKDALFFSLIIPVTRKVGKESDKVEKKLIDGEYSSGSSLIHDILYAFYESYKMDPDSFRMVMLFQQTHMAWEMKEQSRLSIMEKGQYNYEVGRRILRRGMEQGLLRSMDVYALLDILWGLFVGIVQIEDIKSTKKERNKYLESTFKLAETLMTDAVAKKLDDIHYNDAPVKGKKRN